MKSRIYKPFQGLRWKLTLSYTLVTVTALALVGVLAMTGVWFVLTNSNIIEILFISMVKSFIVPPVASYLDDTEPDIQGMERWMNSVATAEGLSFQSPVYSNIRVTISPSGQNITLLVLDENLDYLAGIPEPEEGGLKTLFDLSGGVLAAAQAGEHDPERISQISANKILTIAVPVTSESGISLGVVVFRIINPLRELLMQIFSLFGGSIIVFTLTAGVVGAVFGFITARGLTHRLGNITITTDSWSQGDFTEFIDDQSEDELGQMSKSLNRMAEQLQNLLHSRQELAAIEERNRLARDLHDSVKQQVFAAAMQLGAVRATMDDDSGEALEHLSEAQKLTQQAQEELDTLIRELRLATLGKGCLTEAIKEYATGWSRQNLIASEVRGPDECDLPQEVEEALFRITQEALSNAAKHSGATRVKIHLAVDGDRVALSIRDNGSGFDVANPFGEGVGLRSMGERLELVGGTLDIKSEPGGGTSINAFCQITQGGR